MSYVKQDWNNGDIITAEKLNHIENGISQMNTVILYDWYDETEDKEALYLDPEHTQLFCELDDGSLYPTFEQAKVIYDKVLPIADTIKIAYVYDNGSEEISLVDRIENGLIQDVAVHLALYPNKNECTIVNFFDASKTFTVTFDMQGHGEQVPPQEVQAGSSAEKPGTPTESGWTFDGWYKEPECINAYQGEPVFSDITLYAKWVEE